MLKYKGRGVSNHKTFSSAFKKEVAMKTVANKRKLEEEKPDDVWNSQKRKWTKPTSQIGYGSLTAQEMFTDMKTQ